MKMQEIAEIVTLIGLILAGIFAVKGWLTNVPDSARRYGWRIATFIALGTVVIGWLARDHSWWRFMLNALTAFVVAECIARNWRHMEACRRAERVLRRVYGR